MTNDHPWGLLFNITVNPNYHKCNISLKFSIWKGHRVVYSISGRKRTGFVCVKCMLNPNKRPCDPYPRYHKTPEELDEFVKSQTEIEVPNVS